MLGQLTGEQQAHGRLDLAAGDGRALVVVGQARGLGGDPLEDVVHEAVHDGHGLAGDASVGVHLLQHLVDVDGVAFLPLPLALLVPGADGLGLAGLLGSLGTDFGRHDDQQRRCRICLNVRGKFWSFYHQPTRSGARELVRRAGFSLLSSAGPTRLC